MTISNRDADLAEVTAWRRRLHAAPELGFDLPGTAGFVADMLRQFGCDAVETGIGRCGVVGIIHGRLGEGPTIGLRADMDALPILEETGAAHASSVAGRMHACGHDGHTAMLLGAARRLAEGRDFAGTVVLIFQPAEEIGQGAKAMLADGLMERHGIDRVFGMHNMPGIPVGTFAIRPGAMMGSVAKFSIEVTGRGGHAARPQSTVDPVVVAAHLVRALQTLVARRIDPVEAAVVTVTRVDAGTAFNVLPQSVRLLGTTRTLDMDIAHGLEARMERLCAGIGAAHGARIALDYDLAHPVTFNRAEEAEFAAMAARELAGEDGVDDAAQPVLAGEDFSHMLRARPGALIFIGNGASAALHHPAYDFDDRALAAGMAYWVRLAERALAPGR
jgi:amidohydrolase